MRENFDRAFDFVVGSEGGYVDDPDDPGGETKYGISKRAYPHLDIKSLTLDQAKGIYLSDYWNKSGCNNLPYPLDFCVFDTAVNLGVGRAAKMYSQAVNWQEFLLRRLLYYQSLNKAKYFKGWVNRVLFLTKRILDG